MVEFECSAIEIHHDTDMDEKGKPTCSVLSSLKIVYMVESQPELT